MRLTPITVPRHQQPSICQRGNTQFVAHKKQSGSKKLKTKFLSAFQPWVSQTQRARGAFQGHISMFLLSYLFIIYMVVRVRERKKASRKDKKKTLRLKTKFLLQASLVWNDYPGYKCGSDCRENQIVCDLANARRAVSGSTGSLSSSKKDRRK